MGRVLDKIDEAREILNLSWFNISNEMLREIIGKIIVKEELRALYLDWNRIEDVSPLTEVLLNDNCLRELYIGGNKIVDVTPITEALRNNTSLEMLNIISNEIVDASPITQGLRSNTSLRMLFLFHNPIPDSSILTEIEAMLIINRLNSPKRRVTLFELMMRKLSPLE